MKGGGDGRRIFKPKIGLKEEDFLNERRCSWKKIAQAKEGDYGRRLLKRKMMVVEEDCLNER